MTTEQGAERLDVERLAEALYWAMESVPVGYTGEGEQRAWLRRAKAVAGYYGAALSPATPTPPEGTRLVLMSDSLFDALGADRVDWGEPDEHGWYTPTITRAARLKGDTDG